MEYTKVKHDINGNPRYVFFWRCFLSDQEITQIKEKVMRENATMVNYFSVNECFKAALKKAKTIGGKKYRGSDFEGGIVFQSYNIQETIKNINNLLVN